MSMSIKDLSKKLKISRTGVENRISRIPNFRQKYMLHKNNKSYVTDKGVQIISKVRSINAHRRGVTRHKSDTDTGVTSVTLQMTRKLLKSEKNHNAQLQKQLNATDSSNKRLQKLLDQQQQLQLSTQNRNKHLEGQIKHLKEIPGRVNTNKDIDNKSVRKPRLSFWQRLFGKH